jgi:hypothetical protein
MGFDLVELWERAVVFVVVAAALMASWTPTVHDRERKTRRGGG